LTLSHFKLKHLKITFWIFFTLFKQSFAEMKETKKILIWQILVISLPFPDICSTIWHPRWELLLLWSINQIENFKLTKLVERQRSIFLWWTCWFESLIGRLSCENNKFLISTLQDCIRFTFCSGFVPEYCCLEFLTNWKLPKLHNLEFSKLFFISVMRNEKFVLLVVFNHERKDLLRIYFVFLA